MGLFDRYFKSDAEDPVNQEVIREANDILIWSQNPFSKHVLAWIDAEIDKPIPLTREMATIEAAVRVNTLREVRQYLRRKVSDAELAVQSARED